MADNLVQVTKNYYDSKSADEFYHTIWGGEDIHVGIYLSDDEPIANASARTVKEMATMAGITANTEVLDVGAGYGGAARQLAREIGCQVTCLNLSTTENNRNIEKNKAAGLEDKIKVIEGNFEDLPFAENSFDVVWCEDSFLHSNKKFEVFREIHRVLRPGGNLIFTDPMQADDCPRDVLGPILNRIHLEEMGSVAKYNDFAEKLGMEKVAVKEMPEQLVNHYGRVLDELTKNYEEAVKVSGQEYCDNMKKGLEHWVNGGNKGHLNWGIIQYRKK